MFDSSSNKPYDASMRTKKHKHLIQSRRVRIVTLCVVLLGVSVLVFVLSEQRAAAPQGGSTSPETTSQDTPTVQPEATIPEPKQPPFNSAMYSTSDASSPWVVVNKQNPLKPLSYTPTDLVGAGSGQLLRSTPAVALNKLLQSAAQAGQPMSVLSGYRSYGTQSAVYNNYVRTDGQASADTYSARPGHSEHQSGLAVDLGNGTCDLLACFGDTDAGIWLAQNAHRYGFIIRYPDGKTAVTGYQYEPWHLRYVGVELAAEMRKQNIQTMEEFFGIPGGTIY